MLRLSARVAFWLLAAAIVFSTLSPLELRPQSGHVVLERFGAFFALGSVLMLSYPTRPLRVLLAVNLVAAGLEAAQRLAPGRHGQVLDAAEKLAGAWLGVLVTAAAIATVQLVRARSAAEVQP